MKISRPEPGEYADFYAGYIRKILHDDWSEQMKSAADEFMAILKSLNEDQWSFQYTPEKWTIKQLVLHVIDAERIFAYRALRFARADTTPLAGFDENDYAASGQASARTGKSLLQEFSSVQCATIDFFENLPDEAWMRIGVASGSPMSVRGLAYVTLGHRLHHMAILKERYLEGLG